MHKQREERENEQENRDDDGDGPCGHGCLCAGKVREIGKKGIRVNAVAPGVIETDMTKDLPQDKILPLIPLHRYGKCEEVAAAVSFLAGPDATYITGQVLAVNGGLVI